MKAGTLKASVQYHDYLGTVEADHHDQRSLNDLAEKHGLDTKRYFVIGVQVRSSEVRNNEVAHASIQLLTVDMTETKAGSIDFIREHAVNQGNQLNYQSFPIDISFSEMLDYFKRFELVLYNRQLETVETFEECAGI